MKIREPDRAEARQQPAAVQHTSLPRGGMQQAWIDQSPRMLAEQRAIEASTFARPGHTRDGVQPAWIDQSPRMLAQRRAIEALTPAQPVQTRAKPINETGLPDALKAGMERLSGTDLSGVRVHSNSSKPAQLNALAYAQGHVIHLGPGQERHLPHEAWHVVQQAQGRVLPTRQMAGLGINDDKGLEQEADILGGKAASMANSPGLQPGMASDPMRSDATSSHSAPASPALQLMLADEIEEMRTLVAWIQAKHPNSTVVGMGASPAPIIAYMKSQDIKAFSIPLSVKDDVPMNDAARSELRKMMEARIEGLAGREDILIIDTGITGNSIMNGVRIIKEAYPEKTVQGLSLADSEEERDRHNKKFAEDEAKDIKAVASTDVGLVERSSFFEKLTGGGYKQYRDVGVFKPHRGDQWEAYLADESGTGPHGFDHGSRARYGALVDYLRLAGQNATPPDQIRDAEYETNLNPLDDNRPANLHKLAEDAKATGRIDNIKTRRQRVEEGQKQALEKSCCVIL